jgi:succinate-semialdehyde dehydrogenase/glutarate-semialdehyde dehydrogenase
VQERAYDRFVARFLDKVKTIKVGPGLAPDTKMGPLAHRRRVPAVSDFVEDARRHGGSILAGGQAIDGPGNFFAPTIVAEVPDDSRLMTEEPFGPVAGMVRFKTAEEVLHRANSLPYGLAAYAFTTSTRNATAVSNGLEAGMVAINHLGMALAETPFGGVKDSGQGSEGGTETFDGFLVTKFVTQL